MNDSTELKTTLDNSESRKVHRYFVLNKPINMVSQFVSSDRVRLLSDLSFKFPEGAHAVGRLDSRSEGLLLLTTNKKITRLLFESGTPHERVYLVQVRHNVALETLEWLRKGVAIKVEGGKEYITAPCKAEIVTEPDKYFNNCKPLNIHPPYTWLMLKLTEGKFHQVRKMVAAVNHQCRRLVRVAIEDLQLGELEPGQVKEMNEAEFFEKLRL